MKRRLELIDTSILVELLRVPGMCESVIEIEELFVSKQENGGEFQLPAAAIMETGSHIAKISNGHHRRECSARFESVLQQTQRGETPWTFTELAWGAIFMSDLLSPTFDHQRISISLANQHLEMGDLLILAEFRRLRSQLDISVVDLDVWTLDTTLRAAIDDIRSD